jgi:hypothetical protein
VSPSTWRSCGRPSLFEFAYVRIVAYASRNENGVALRVKNAPTWLASSLGAAGLHVTATRAGVELVAEGLQRKPLAVNQSIMKPMRNVPGAPEPAVDVRRPPVEPQRFAARSGEERARPRLLPRRWRGAARAGGSSFGLRSPSRPGCPGCRTAPAAELPRADRTGRSLRTARWPRTPAAADRLPRLRLTGLPRLRLTEGRRLRCPEPAASWAPARTAAGAGCCACASARGARGRGEPAKTAAFAVGTSEVSQAVASTLVLGGTRPVGSTSRNAQRSRRPARREPTCIIIARVGKQCVAGGHGSRGGRRIPQEIRARGATGSSAAATPPRRW